MKASELQKLLDKTIKKFGDRTVHLIHPNDGEPLEIESCEVDSLGIHLIDETRAQDNCMNDDAELF